MYQLHGDFIGRVRPISGERVYVRDIKLSKATPQCQMCTGAVPDACATLNGKGLTTVAKGGSRLLHNHDLLA